MTYNISNMYTIVDHLHKHLTHPKHLLHNVLLSIGVAGLLMAVDQFYTGNYQLLAAGQMPAHTLTILPERMNAEDSDNSQDADASGMTYKDQALKNLNNNISATNYTDSAKVGVLANGIYKVAGLPDLVPATNSVRGVCYIKGTDMWDVHNHRTCMTGEPVCRTIKGVVIGCESKRIIR